MKRLSLLLTVLGLLAVPALLQVGSAAGAPARPAPAFAHPLLRDDGAEFEEEEAEEGEEGEFEFEDCEAEADEFEFELEEEEFEEEAEEEEFEFEEECGEADKAAKKGAPYVTAPAPCEIRQAESTITTLPGSDQVRLTLRYQTWSPTPVTLGLKLKDAKGAISIERSKEHLSNKGVLHLTTKLGSAVMDRAEAAREFDVSLRAPRTPAYCADALEQQLHVTKHTAARSPRVFAN